MGSIRARVMKSLQKEGTKKPEQSPVGAKNLLQSLTPSE
jgi:hypothetical protein